MEKLVISAEENKELGVHFLRLSGAVDVFSYKDLKDFLDPWTQGGAVKRVLVDMGKVGYVGSSGWSVFFLQSGVQEKEGGFLILYGMNERVQRSLDLIMPKKRGIQTAENLESAVALMNELAKG
jgi:anti-anti-sigma factor